MNDPIFVYVNKHRIVNLNYVVSIEQQVNMWGEKEGIILYMADGEVTVVSDWQYANRIEEMFFNEGRVSDNGIRLR